MSARAATVLGRFPRHLEADATGKRFASVVAGLGADLDTQTGQVGDIRRAHRLPDAPTTTDLLRLAGLHGLGAAALVVLGQRLAALAPVADVLADPASAPADVEAALAELADLVVVDPAGFTSPEDGGDPEPGRLRLGRGLAPLATLGGRLGVQRHVVRGVVAAHRTGNGTASGLLRAAAAYLGLEVVEPIAHSEDRWWHLAACADQLAPTPLDPPDVAIRDLLALEENPPQPTDVGPTPRRHGDRFALLRGGLEAVPVTVMVDGIEDRTVAPMVVNRDTGSGVAFEGVVPDGSRLRFLADGRVDLDGTSVLSRSYSFRGSVFADESAPVPGYDFLFAPDEAAEGDGEGGPPRPVDGILADHTAWWAVTEPVADAFASDGAFPHAEGLVEPVWLARGRTRWAVFVGPGTYALRWRVNGRIRNAAPRFDAAFFDRTVFEPDPPPEGAPSLAVGLAWEEREAFAVRLWIPRRFASLDGADEAPVRERMRILLDRHRAAGVRLSADYADPRWTLGVGLLRDLDSTDPLGLVINGTTTWSTDTEQPTPS